jgi:hypothetical protein
VLRSIVVLAMLAAPATASCPELPAGFSFQVATGPHHRDDTMTLLPPYAIRTDRRGGGHCEIEMSACGRDNTWTADDVIAVLARPGVADALAKHAHYGDAKQDGFVLIHGHDSLVVGPPCEGCASPPADVAAVVEMLDHIYELRIAAECTTKL